ncbi:dexamethasone-induced protein isoform X1 [Symphalangus syndactylus]|uniref:dexamethasone-induced protein isoform X1 n=1 Tax=Symphalangus syndactylus TaxID=9590 RepID=UPI0024435F33|nr:dexamethasone-induced protein isoform X2 [Symphalangus syndactylus]
MPPQLVGGTIWTGMVPQEETLPCLRGLPAPLKSFVPTKRFLFGPRRVEERLGLSAEVEKAPAPTEGGRQGGSQNLICLQRHTDGLALASDYLQLRWMFTGTQPEFASLHFIPERTCFPHFTFGEDTSNCGHTQKRLPGPFDARRLRCGRVRAAERWEETVVAPLALM